MGNSYTCKKERWFNYVSANVTWNSDHIGSQKENGNENKECFFFTMEPSGWGRLLRIATDGKSFLKYTPFTSQKEFHLDYLKSMCKVLKLMSLCNLN